MPPACVKISYPSLKYIISGSWSSMHPACARISYPSLKYIISGSWSSMPPACEKISCPSLNSVLKDIHVRAEVISNKSGKNVKIKNCLHSRIIFHRYNRGKDKN